MIQHLAWHAFAMAFLWVPFAAAAGIVDGWSSDNGRVLRAKLAHPMLAMRDWRFAHGHAPAH